MLGIRGKDWWRVLGFTFLGTVYYYGTAMASGLAVGGGIVLTPKIRSIPLSWIALGVWVTLALVPTFGLSAVGVLKCGPKEGRINLWSLWALSFYLSLAAGVCVAVAGIYQQKLQGDFTGLVVKCVGIAVPMAWCLTWAIDVTRRRKT